MLLYYITERKQFPGGEAEQRRRLLEKIGEVAAAGVDYIQLRERDLTGRELEKLAGEVIAVVKSATTTARLLINSRTDVALACGADGVHLRSDDVTAADARAIAGGRKDFIVSVACHTVEEVKLAWSHGADFAVFAPVFEKDDRPGSGLHALRQACAVTPNFVIAMGGVTAENSNLCRKASAVGVAGIRLFQRSDARQLMSLLKRFQNRN
jgi:thiamine-phosphate pyrophosphorylase